MNNDRPTVLILENDPIFEDEQLILEEAGFKVVVGHELCQGLELLQQQEEEWDAFVVDLSVPSGDPDLVEGKWAGVSFLGEALKNSPKAAVIVVSQYLPIQEAAASALLSYSAGRLDLKTIGKAQFEEPLKQWAEEVFRERLASLEAARMDPYRALDPRVKRIVDDLIPTISSTRLPVLILGETGTGKEELARRIHYQSKYKDGEFISVNCAAMAETLVISELFGHVKGAFTGAEKNRLGRLAEASGWTSPSEDVADDYSVEKVVEAILEVAGTNRDELFGRILNPSERDKVKSELKNLAKLIGNIKDSSSGGTTEYLTWLRRMGHTILTVKPSNSGNIKAMGKSYEQVRSSEAMYYHFSKANPGTLFLDEVGDLGPTAEAALLRALEGDGFLPVGYTGKPLLANCRIIAATSRISSLSDLEPKGNSPAQMRSDLYWRLAGWVVHLPPLRERFDRDGIPEPLRWLTEIAQKDGFHFDEGVLEKYHEQVKSSKGRPWSGNWRELRYTYARAKAAAQIRPGNKLITAEDMQFASAWALQAEIHEGASDSAHQTPGQEMVETGDKPGDAIWKRLSNGENLFTLELVEGAYSFTWLGRNGNLQTESIPVSGNSKGTTGMRLWAVKIADKAFAVAVVARIMLELCVQGKKLKPAYERIIGTSINQNSEETTIRKGFPNEGIYDGVRLEDVRHGVHDELLLRFFSDLPEPHPTGKLFDSVHSC